MIFKFSIWRIVIDHIDTLRNAKSRKYRPLDFITLFAVPVSIGGMATYYGYTLNKEIINSLMTSLSVFAALLFNLLLLVYSIVQRDSTAGLEKVRTKFLKEIYANISFCILLTVITIALLLITFIGIDAPRFTLILTLTVYSLTAIFLLTLLMILRRVHALLFGELT
jgi:magnesium-transporting ATPase (P-type)